MQEQDGERAARSLDQAGVSTSTQMTVNLRTDLGGDQNGSLRVSCMLDAAQQQASLRQVLYRPRPLHFSCSLGMSITQVHSVRKGQHATAVSHVLQCA